MRVAIALVAAVLVVGVSIPGEATRLRPEVTVSDDSIRLGDLFADLPSGADRVATRAPAPGSSVVLDAQFLNRVARVFRLNWTTDGFDDQVVVHRASQVIGSAAMTDALLPELSRHLPVARIDVIFDRPDLEVHLPVTSVPRIRVEYLDFRALQQRFRARLIVGSGRDLQRIQVSGRAIGRMEVPVLVRFVRPGEAIEGDAIAWLETRYESSHSDIIRSEAELIGKTPRRAVPLNRPLRHRDFQAPRLVDRGDLVTVVLQTRSMTLSTQGRALDRGGRGDVIRVVNTQSNRTVEATVTAPGRVTVGPFAAAIN